MRNQFVFYSSLIVIIVVSILLFTSCSNSNNSYISNQTQFVDKNFFDELNVSPVSKKDDFYEYTFPCFIESMFSKPKYPKDILDDNAYIFDVEDYKCAILKVKQNKKFYYLFMLYNKSDGMLVDSIYTDMFYDINSLDRIKKGDNAEKIKSFTTSSIMIGQDKHQSFVWLNDGKCMVFTIDKNTIVNIEVINDEYHLFDILKSYKGFDIFDLCNTG